MTGLDLGPYRKTIVAVVGALVAILTDPAVVPLLPAGVAAYVQPFVVVATAFGVYAVPNRATPVDEPGDGPKQRFENGGLDD